MPNFGVKEMCLWYLQLSPFLSLFSPSLLRPLGSFFYLTPLISNHVLRESAISMGSISPNTPWDIYSQHYLHHQPPHSWWMEKSLFLTLGESERIHQWNFPSISEIVSCWEGKFHLYLFVLCFIHWIFPFQTM